MTSTTPCTASTGSVLSVMYCWKNWAGGKRCASRWRAASIYLLGMWATAWESVQEISPGLGDMDQGLTLPAFGEAARLLKPLRARSRLNNFIGPPPSGSNDEHAWQLACDAYMSRFDLF